MLPLLLVACAAERVGVTLPTGGENAIQAADLRWDLWRITDPRIGGRAPGSSGARRVAARLAERLGEAGFAPGFPDGYRAPQGRDSVAFSCGRREGSSGEAIVVVALDPGIGNLSAVPIAGLLALARAYDSPTVPTHTMVFCVLPEAGGIASYARNPVASIGSTRAFFVVGSLTGKSLSVALGGAVSGITPTLLHTGPLAAALGDDMGRVRFGVVEARTRVAYSAISAVD